MNNILRTLHRSQVFPHTHTCAHTHEHTHTHTHTHAHTHNETITHKRTDTALQIWGSEARTYAHTHTHTHTLSFPSRYWVRVFSCAKQQRERINCTSVYLFLYGKSSVKMSTQTDSYYTMNTGLKNVSICSQQENCQISLKIVSIRSQISS